MPISSEVPTSYMSRWNASAPQPTPISSRDDSLSPSGSATFKYNTSCSKCRESRVKCSGGTPCQRCAASDNPSLCAYSVSRRRGKRKASDGPSELAAQVEAPVQPDVLDITALDPFVLHEWDVPDGIAWPDSDTAANSTGDSVLVQPSPLGDLGGFAGTSTTFPNLFGSIPLPSAPPSSGTRERGPCRKSCYASIHSSSNKLITALNEKGTAGLGNIMHLLDTSSADAHQYLDCPLCDTGCTRLMNLAHFHQRQLNLLTHMCGNPAVYVRGDSTRVSLGSYQPSTEDDLVLKRIMLLGVTRRVRASVNAFRERANGFEERHAAGILELAEAGRLNLVWILGIAANLTRRLDEVRSALENEDWGGDIVE